MVVTDPAPLPPDHPDAEVVAALRGGDADRFDDLVRELTPGLARMARLYVTGALADDVVQDTWLAVVDALDTFEGRSSLKTWIFRILLNKVRTLAVREARAVPVASLGPDLDPGGPRLELVHDELGPGYWPAPPEPWETLAPERLERNETLDRIAEAIEALPTAQREVVESATSRAGRHPTLRTRSGSPTSTSGCCCTTAARRSATPSRSTSVRPDHPVHTGGGIRCSEAIELVTLHLDDALDDRDRRLFERHVDACTGCTRYVAQIHQTIDLTRRVLEHMTVARQPPPDELRAAFVTRRRRSV